MGGGHLPRAARVADLTRVLAEARHARFDQRRSSAGAGRVDRLAHDPVHLQRIGAVDADADDRVTHRAIGHAAYRRLLFKRHRDGDAVVLAEEHHRQLVHRREVQAFVEIRFG